MMPKKNHTITPKMMGRGGREDGSWFATPSLSPRPRKKKTRHATSIERRSLHTSIDSFFHPPKKIRKTELFSKLRPRPRRLQDRRQFQRHRHRPPNLELARHEQLLGGRFAGHQLGKVGVGDGERDGGFGGRVAFGHFFGFAGAQVERPLGAVDVEDDDVLVLREKMGMGLRK